MSRRERQQSTKGSTKSVTEGATTKHELEHKKCHGGSTTSVTEGATTKHEVGHKKCHGGSDQKARIEAQKVLRGERPKGENFSAKSVTEGAANWQRFCIVKVELELNQIGACSVLFLVLFLVVFPS